MIATVTAAEAEIEAEFETGVVTGTQNGFELVAVIHVALPAIAPTSLQSRQPTPHNPRQ